jgi:ABC-type multidrug transport system fused ATPase/permease subunit
MINNLYSNTIRKSLSILNKRELLYLSMLTTIQVVLGFLDLLGVAAIGVLGSIATSGIQNKPYGDRVTLILEFLNIENKPLDTQSIVIGTIAATLLVTRTILSILITKKTLFYLSNKSAELTSKLLSKMFTKEITFIQSRTSQETLYALTTGVGSVTLNIIATTTTLVVDSSLLVVLLVGLFFIDPYVTFMSILLFGTISLVLHKLMNKKAQSLGELNAKLSISSGEKIIEVLNTYREAVVKHRRQYYLDVISKDRKKLGELFGEISFMPYVSKYTMEIAVVIGVFILSAYQFVYQTSSSATATIVVFLAAGARIAPAILRLQQGILLVKSGIGYAQPTLNLIELLSNSNVMSTQSAKLDFSHIGFSSSVVIENVHFKYSRSEKFNLKEVSIKISEGSLNAFIGKSGAGKSTLADIILGVLQPQTGKVLISGLPPSEAISRWPGAISYVPQDVLICNGTILENVILGYDKNEVPLELVWDALDKAHLSNFVKELPTGLNTYVGERGTQLSGGQRQRLGIARALFTKPKFIIFDEATNALDGNTEFEVSESINSLKGQVTIIIIAHRLSTIKNIENIYYIETGNIKAFGKFTDLVNQVPDLMNQVNLSNL